MKGEGTMIREAKTGDAREILGIYAHYVENTAISSEYDVPEMAVMEERISEHGEKYAFLVLEKEGHIKGYANGSRFRDRKAYERTVEVSVYVHKDQLMKGYGGALMKELLKRLKEKDMKTAVAVVTSENEASSRAFTAMGSPMPVIFPR